MKRGADYKNIALQGITFLFIVLFVYVAASKLMDFEVFRIRLGQAPMLGSIAEGVAIGIPAAEILVSILLAFETTRLWGLYGAFTLMAVFTGYIAWALNFSSSLPCTCNGVFETLSWNEHLWFNSAFLGLAAVGIVFQKKQKPSWKSKERKYMQA